MKSVSLLLSCFLALIYTVSSDNTACPTFEDGSWAVGEIRTAVNERGQSTRILKRHYSDKTPRSCCDACARIEECKYWTIILTSKTSFVGKFLFDFPHAVMEIYVINNLLQVNVISTSPLLAKNLTMECFPSFQIVLPVQAQIFVMPLLLILQLMLLLKRKGMELLQK